MMQLPKFLNFNVQRLWCLLDNAEQIQVTRNPGDPNGDTAPKRSKLTEFYASHVMNVAKVLLIRASIVSES